MNKINLGLVKVVFGLIVVLFAAGCGEDNPQNSGSSQQPAQATGPAAWVISSKLESGCYIGRSGDQTVVLSYKVDSKTKVMDTQVIHSCSLVDLENPRPIQPGSKFALVTDKAFVQPDPVAGSPPKTLAFPYRQGIGLIVHSDDQTVSATCQNGSLTPGPIPLWTIPLVKAAPNECLATEKELMAAPAPSGEALAPRTQQTKATIDFIGTVSINNPQLQEELPIDKVLLVASPNIAELMKYRCLKAEITNYYDGILDSGEFQLLRDLEGIRFVVTYQIQHLTKKTPGKLTLSIDSNAPNFKKVSVNGVSYTIGKQTKCKKLPVERIQQAIQQTYKLLTKQAGA